MSKHHHAVLILNAGSSSIKFALFSCHEAALRRQLHGQIERIGADAVLQLFDASGARGQRTVAASDHLAALQQVLALLAEAGEHWRLLGVGHRVVHGGERFRQPVRVDAGVEAALRELIPLAPLHQPHALSAMAAMRQLSPTLPQVACFDTAFHHTLPPLASHYALPQSWYEQGVRRYGFHGLSYEYLSGLLPQHLGAVAEGRVVIAHLGNGASLCGLRQRQSVATTMGFTPLDGLPMGTRCGAIDPGVLLYLMQQQGMSVEQLQQLLYHQSGLLGLSGLSADMRELLASESPAAQLALDFFVQRCVEEIGRMAAALGGLDALVFSGGIGEHAGTIRAAIGQRLGWLGVVIDEAANAAPQTAIHAQHSRVPVLVLHTDEEQQIARHTVDMLAPR